MKKLIILVIHPICTTFAHLNRKFIDHAAEEQAIARAHRIGQQRSVFVYRFVSAGTLEEQILTLQDRKQSLIDSVMPFICKS